ncbi:MAG: efflux RND transporter periplasmic adaptor subunit [Gemmatimonadota bacterium]|nr:efflux RND transporter periplasmic adaptor subunit [Gemmatimonadota bacterium]
MMRMHGMPGLAMFAAAALTTCCGGRKAVESVDVPPVPVRTVKVVERDISTVVRACGVTASSRQMKLSFKTGGIIRSIPVEEGESVKKGALIASLELTEIRARLSQAEIAHEKAGRDLARIRNLYSDSVVTTEQLQDAVSAFDMAAAELDVARYNLNHSTIKAPSQGRILKKLVERNELVRAGAPVVLFSSSDAGFVLRVGVIDREVMRLGLGDSASVTFDSFDEAGGKSVFPAYVSEMPAGSSSGMFEIELTILDKGGPQVTLLSGMFGCAEIYSGHIRHLPVIPLEALVDADGDRAYVFISLGDSVRRRRVRLGALQRQGAGVAVAAGLSAGEEVVTQGALYLKENSRIKAIPAGEFKLPDR